MPIEPGLGHRGVSGRTFSQGVGEWIGAAEVYDAAGRYAGKGRDTRSVRADDRAGRVTVDVTFDGPFSLSGTYTIVDQGSHRTYEGPLNVGLAEALGDGLVAAHNYWPDLGLSQRFFLMVLPGGTRQLSLALLSRGERLRWTVVGEYQRQPTPPSAPPPGSPPASTTARDPAVLRYDSAAGRNEILLLRAGRWSGPLHCLDADLEPCGTVDCTEVITSRDGRVDAGLQGHGLAEPSDHAAGMATRCFDVELQGLGFAADVAFALMSDGWGVWTPVGDLAGSATLSGGRAMSGQFHHRAGGLRVWRREVASLDGTMKAVLNTWHRGEQRLGAAYGTLAFHPA